MKKHKTATRTLLVVVLALLVTAATYAFTASNSVPATKAGAGSGAITGYNVTNVQYTLGANPLNIDAVEFDLDAAASDVKITLVTPAGTVYDCGPDVLLHVTCDTTVGTQATVSPANSLTVVSVS